MVQEKGGFLVCSWDSSRGKPMQCDIRQGAAAKAAGRARPSSWMTIPRKLGKNVFLAAKLGKNEPIRGNLTRNGRNGFSPRRACLGNSESNAKHPAARRENRHAAG